MSSTTQANGEGQPTPESPVAGPSRPSKKLTVDDLKDGLAKLGLDTKGKKETLFKRLTKAVVPQIQEEHQDESVSPVAQDKWDAFLCFDVEATCRGGTEFDWPNEIIEFPVVLLRWSDPLKDDQTTSNPGSESKDKGKRVLRHVDTFHSYVKPTWEPKLSQFCTVLTGITQETVDKSPTFPEMIPLLDSWLRKHDLLDENGRLKKAMWVTDGPWDLRDFIPKQLHITPLPDGPPAFFFSPYLNIKYAVQSVLSETWLRQTYAKSKPGQPPPYDRGMITTGKQVGKKYRESSWRGPNYFLPIPGQLRAFGLGEFEGREHSGIDDATNISRILIAISERDVLIEPNARGLHINGMKRWPWMGAPGVVKWEGWMTDNPEVERSFGDGPNQKTEGGETEWQLKTDAAGRLVAVHANKLVNTKDSEPEPDLNDGQTPEDQDEAVKPKEEEREGAQADKKEEAEDEPKEEDKKDTKQEDEKGEEKGSE